MTTKQYGHEADLAKVGGIFVETTSDPQGGWFLGDKTRKFQHVEDVQEVTQRMGLELNVTYDGSNVTVRVANPDYVIRMLCAKNDDVGSIVNQARTDRGPLEALTAGPEQHIMIEPSQVALVDAAQARGVSVDKQFPVEEVRVRVYPVPGQ